MAANANHDVRPSDTRLGCALPTGIVTAASETNALVFVAVSKLPPALSLAPDSFRPGTFLRSLKPTQQHTNTELKGDNNERNERKQIRNPGANS
ncbi:MAG: hypothetical protein NT154_25095 [Verrucomicrobia bacterium]|nr:hypothetical protein [Verrucomicrobiota bacterium]